MSSSYYIRAAVRRSPTDADTARQLREFGVATVAESQAKQGLFEAEVRPIQASVAISGPAITVLTPAGDNLMIHAAIEVCQPGDVLVVTTLAPSNHGAFGELLAEACVQRGLAGIILDVGVRDTRAIRTLGLPVWSRAIFAGGTVKTSPGWVNSPIVAAGVPIHPGDFIVADDDGVMAVPRADVQDVLERARARVAREDATRKRIRAGELSVEFYNLRPLLQTLGVAYLDTYEPSQPTTTGAATSDDGSTASPRPRTAPKPTCRP